MGDDIPTLIVVDTETATGQPFRAVPGIDENVLEGLNPKRTALTSVQVFDGDAGWYLRVGPIDPVVTFDEFDVAQFTTPDVQVGVIDPKLVSGKHVIEETYPNETAMLVRFDELMAELADKHDEDTLIVTWNGGQFDVPMVMERSQHARAKLHFWLAGDRTDRTPKYQALPGHEPSEGSEATGMYSLRWHQLAHLDVAYAYKAYAADLDDVRWSLKPVAESRGIPMVHADREKMHLLSHVEHIAYGMSDVIGLHELVTRDFVEMQLADAADR